MTLLAELYVVLRVGATMPLRGAVESSCVQLQHRRRSVHKQIRPDADNTIVNVPGSGTTVMLPITTGPPVSGTFSKYRTFSKSLENQFEPVNSSGTAEM
jgi:hypothetical protein